MVNAALGKGNVLKKLVSVRELDVKTFTSEDLSIAETRWPAESHNRHLEHHAETNHCAPVAAYRKPATDGVPQILGIAAAFK